MGKPDALTRRDNEEKAGLEHRLFDVGQLNEIHLANYADEHVDDEPIVVVHQGKTIESMVPIESKTMKNMATTRLISNLNMTSGS